MDFKEGFLDEMIERYGSPSSPDMDDWFKESFGREKTVRVIQHPTLDELANALMSGAKVSITYVNQVYDVIQKVTPVHVPGEPWRSAIPNVAVNEKGERSYLVEIREAFITKEMYVRELKTDTWETARTSKSENPTQWSAVLAIKLSDDKGYQTYTWVEELKVVFDGKEVFIKKKDDV